ncbi:Uncharacterised protein [Escherichia coli]|nr:hypothetical protein [Escherichia coli]CAD5540589.1 Uncharacterised protein [Escherichia coli]CAD5688382.1 Uncharacterised protein [Escherichia coli]CAD5879549.1 Uncharacterised protein [Escherichia coli]CTW91016.1 Uncharacterised protein [Escherichia coli]
MHAFTFPMLTFLVSVDSGFQGIDEAGYHSCVRCCRYIRETQVNPQCRQAGMNIQCVPHRLTNTLLPEGVVFVGHGYISVWFIRNSHIVKNAQPPCSGSL